MFPRKLASVVGIVGLAFAGSASATFMFTFDDPTDVLLTTYDFTIDGAHVHATVTYDLTSINSTTAEFDVTGINTSTGAGQNRLVSFGVDVVTPPLTGASTTNSLPTAGEWDAVAGPVTFPGFQKVDLCSYAGPNCSGGSSLGVLMGQTDTFHLILMGAFGTVPSVTFTSPFPGKFQGVGNAGQSYEVDACAGSTACVPGPPRPVPDNGVPEPGTLALLGLGLWGLYAAQRRKLS